MRVSVNRKRGVAHWIEHVNGTKPCGGGDWSCAALKPYPRDESKREYSLLKARWETFVAREITEGV